MLAEARLVVEDVPARARCIACDLEFGVGAPPRLWCPHCDGAAAELLTGRELELTGVQLAEGARSTDGRCPGARTSAGAPAAGRLDVVRPGGGA